MNCKQCGAQLAATDQFCQNCGTPVNAPVNTNSAPVAQPTEKIEELQPTPEVMAPAPEIIEPVQVPQQPIPQAAPQQTPQAMPQQMPQAVPQPMPQAVPQQMPQAMPQQMPQAMPQQMPQAMPQPPMQPTNNGSGSGLKIGLILAGVVIVIMLIIIVVLATTGNKAANTNNGNNVNNVNNQVSNYTVNHAGYTFKIPTNLIYKVEGDSITVADEENTWAAQITSEEGSYNQLLSKKSQLKLVYQNAGYTSTDAVEKKINNASFVTIELGISGQNALLAFTKANSMNIFGVAVINIDNGFDYDKLEIVANILSTATYTDNSNHLESNAFDLEALADSAASMAPATEEETSETEGETPSEVE